MSRQPSDKTTIRNLRRELAAKEITLYQFRGMQIEVKVAREETAEWKRRFDLLLARTPEVKP